MIAYLQFGSADNPPMQTVACECLRVPHSAARIVNYEGMWRKLREDTQGRFITLFGERIPVTLSFQE